MTPEAAYAARLEMVRTQIEARGITDPAVLAAMRTVPRHAFVPPEQVPKAYRDRPLPIGSEQTISQPYIVALMAQLLHVGAGDRVLEVGAGCGYQAAVLAELASEVYAIERVQGLADETRERLAALHYTSVHLLHGDGFEGWPEAAPFDGIVVSCGAERVPPALLDQLAPGRRLVIPVGPPGRVMDLEVWTRNDDGTCGSEQVLKVRFVPLLRGLAP